MSTTIDAAPATEPVRIPRDILDAVDKRVEKAVRAARVDHVPGMRAAIVASLLREALGLTKPQG